MTALRVLHMRNTNRTLDNLPPTLDDLENLRVTIFGPYFLQDVDFAENSLTSVPEALFKLKNLRKLDLSGNKVDFVPSLFNYRLRGSSC